MNYKTKLRFSCYNAKINISFFVVEEWLYHMREYKIKKGHNVDIGELISKYFEAKGDIYKGIKFEIDGIGRIDMRQEKNSLFIDIVPPKKVCGDYSIIKKWNTFLFEATGKDVKERKKDFGKIK